MTRVTDAVEPCRWAAELDEFFSHGGAEARRIQIQSPVDNSGNPVAHQRFTEIQQVARIPVQLNRTVDHHGSDLVLLHLRVFVPP